MSCAGDRKGWRLPALYRKALRDLWLLRGQALAIMLVVAGAFFSISQTVYHKASPAYIPSIGVSHCQG